MVFHHNPQFLCDSALYHSDCKEAYPAFTRYSQHLFQRMRWKNICWQIRCCLTRESGLLPTLAMFKPQFMLENGRDKGYLSVPLNMVVGSASEIQDFDTHFAPRSDKSLQRWSRIAKIYLLTQSLPAVDLIAVDGFCFVQDGHHRVSVARAFGLQFIDAHVIEFVLKVNF